jgi:hypothetical protein
MKSQNTKSSDELQNEVRHEIRNVRKDIDELAGRLSPGQLIDDVIFYPHGRNPGATFDHLKRNPVGTAFLSLGTILLMEDESNQSFETLSKNKVAAVRNKVTEAKQKMNMGPTTKELAMDKVNEFKDKMDAIKSDVEYKVAEAQDKMSTVQEKISSVKSEATDKMSTMSEQVQDKVGSMTDEFGNALPATPDAATLKNKVTDKFSGLMSSGKDKVHDLEPMTFMALGAGLGVITGAAIPVSDTEQSFVDGQFQERLSGFSTDLQSAINECTNILKDLVVSDVKDFKANLF